MSDRVDTYMGPSVQVTPDAIEKYEKAGCWVADEKKDGAWAEVKTNENGVIVSIRSRTGRSFEPSETAGLLGLQTPLLSCTLASELEAKSNAATVRFQAFGYRRLHIFDTLKVVGLDATKKDIHERRKLVNLIRDTLKKDETIAKRLRIVRQVEKGFRAFYDDVMAEGGEGLVFKKVGSLYTAHYADGKAADWVRCKPYRFVDYVITSVGKSPSGIPNWQVGLYFNGTLTRVCTIKDPPGRFDLHAHIGRVIECKGAEVFPSGALRHGHFERLRDDKRPEECTYEAAQAVQGT